MTIICSARYPLSVGTMKEKLGGGSSRSVTLYSKGPSQPKININSLTMGRTLHGDLGDLAWRLPVEGQQPRHSHKHLEYQIVMSFLPLEIRSYVFSFNVCSYRAPRPEHFWPGLLGGSMEVRYHLSSCLLSYGKYIFYPNERVVRSFNYLT